MVPMRFYEQREVSKNPDRSTGNIEDNCPDGDQKLRIPARALLRGPHNRSYSFSDIYNRQSA